ncbi:MAG: hypothetical protein RIS63_1154 [Bacteroidota bacterium]|jgi:hypothetical protein
MSPEQALALLNLNHQDPYEEQIEVMLFELKQKIYRQLDQLLLYPKWIKELSRLSAAASALGIVYSEETLAFIKVQNEQSLQPNKSMLDQFNAQHQLKSQVALQLYNGSTPGTLMEIIGFWFEQQKAALQYWSGANIITPDTLLSKQFNPQEVLLLLSNLQQSGIIIIEDLQQQTTPSTIQQYIAWNKAVWSKLQDA